ncbi:unnamed protein product [Rotaria socialis]|uniref:MYND-type domain-containing protein n=1 Tax=Rotaria socialis TaxID=392032 RepID=A0A819AKX8_9BILA|nr:unnamed protein product [Rotaria socialis]CAF4842228.1 unnamed protein product [Rotaria socialis]
MANISSDVRNYFKLELLLTRSCALLRHLFKNRYSQFNSGQTWNDTSACGNSYFTNVIVKNKQISLTAVQKTSVSSGNSDEWDVTTLTALLLNSDHPKTLNAAEIQQLDQENALVEQLRDIRNKLAHNTTKSVDDLQFNQLWTDLTAILIALGDINTELDKLKDDSIFESPTQIINEDSVKEASHLNSLATQAHKDGKFSEGITLFTKATLLPGVADHDRAIFFSNMASSRLALYEKQSCSTGRVEIDDPNDQRYRALQDAKQARILRSTWWKGHLRVGKVYTALNEHEKAINSFERALALAPTNDDIKKALDESHHILGRQQRQEHLDPESKPKSILEQLNDKQQKFGLNSEAVCKTYKLFREKNPSLADVEKGYKYEHGDNDVKQNYEEAARYFEKAARQGNAEGMYNLARLSEHGLGVKKDHNIAQNLYEQAAAEPPYHSELYNIRNNGVAEAEHALGVRYAEGVVVNKNLGIAACWYQRAFKHGNVQSGNSLALLYENGSGVILDLDKAEQIFEQAAEQGDSNAMYNLATLLTRRAKLPMAKVWYDRACKAGHIVAQSDRGFKEDVQAKHNIIRSFSPDTLPMMDKIFEIFSSLKTTTSASTAMDGSDFYDYRMLLEHANCGSKTARIMCDALEHFSEALYTFTQNDTLTKDEENLIMHNLSQCHRIEHIVARYPSIEIRNKLKDLVDRVLRRCNTTVSQLDEDTRTCFAGLNMDSPTLVINFLSLCKQKYPKSIYFFELSASMNGFLRQYDDTLYEANLGLEIDQNYCQLLYDKAGALRFLEKDMDEAIEAYRAFLAIAPKDHRKVPDSYYAMAMCYLMSKNDQSLENATKMYQKGEEAEKLQLPCFLPYDPSIKTPTKLELEMVSWIKIKISTLHIDNKARLKDPVRIEVIVEQRQCQNQLLKAKNKPGLISIPFTYKARISQRTTKSLAGLKSITFRDIDPVKDHVYERYVLSVTIIGEAYSWAPSIQLMTEDEHLDCKKLCIYDFPKDQGEYLIKKVFRIGTKMNIINPYLRIDASDKKPVIGIDEFSSIMMQSESEYVVNMCRCCGRANASYICGNCKQARYCTKECQTMDWQLYKHKLICIKE